MKRNYEEKPKLITDVLELAEEMDIPVKFPKNVLAAADAVPDCVSESDMDGREDFREEITITIDGPDAKDLDDAVSLAKLSSRASTLSQRGRTLFTSLVE